MHTAVKIEPHYHGPTVHVLDASRAVGVAGNLLSRDPARRLRGRRARRVPRHARAAEPARGPRSGGSRSRTRAGTGWRSTGPAAYPPVPCCHRPDGARRLPARRAGAADRLDAVLPDLGAGGPLPRHSRATRRSARRRREPVPGRPGAARPDRPGAAAPRARRVRRLPRQRGRRRHRALRRRGPHRAAGRDPHAPAADAQAARPAQPGAGRLRGARATRASPDYVGAFAVTTGHGLDALAADVRGRSTTTTTRSWPRRWRTGWRRRSPSGCTSGCAGSTGATRRTRRSTTPPSSASSTRASGRRPGYPACPDHTEKRTLFDLLRRRVERRDHAHRELRDAADAPSSAAATSGIRRRSTSASARSSATRSRTTPAGRAWTSPTTERWLAPNLNYER